MCVLISFFCVRRFATTEVKTKSEVYPQHICLLRAPIVSANIACAGYRKNTHNSNRNRSGLSQLTALVSCAEITIACECAISPYTGVCAAVHVCVCACCHTTCGEICMMRPARDDTANTQATDIRRVRTRIHPSIHCID